jgi:hypothetical protein
MRHLMTDTAYALPLPLSPALTAAAEDGSGTVHIAVTAGSLCSALRHAVAGGAPGGDTRPIPAGVSPTAPPPGGRCAPLVAATRPLAEAPLW